MCVQLWEYRAYQLRVIDGDTMTVLLDQGFHSRREEELRLVGVYAPELRELGGKECKEFVSGWLKTYCQNVDWPLLVTTLKNTNPEPEEKRSFTRYLANVRTIDQNRNLNEDIIAFLSTHPEWGPGQ